jgi:hypothetical protein
MVVKNNAKAEPFLTEREEADGQAEIAGVGEAERGQIYPPRDARRPKHRIGDQPQYRDAGDRRRRHDAELLTRELRSGQGGEDEAGSGDVDREGRYERAVVGQVRAYPAEAE